MKKILISILLVFFFVVMLNGCIVSDQKLADKVQEAIVNDVAQNGKQLEVTTFELGDKQGKNYKGVLQGKIDGEEVVYDVTVTDEGSDFDVDWEQRK